MSTRESFKSNLGFVLVSAGCAIGIGNVWKFPYVAGANGGGIFVLFYLLFNSKCIKTNNSDCLECPEGYYMLEGNCEQIVNFTKKPCIASQKELSYYCVPVLPRQESVLK